VLTCGDMFCNVLSYPPFPQRAVTILLCAVISPGLLISGTVCVRMVQRTVRYCIELSFDTTPQVAAGRATSYDGLYYTIVVRCFGASMFV
jgi:hypothetical protein